MKTSLVVVFFVVLAALTFGYKYKIEEFNENKISGGELRSPLQNIFVHISEEHYLKVNGKIYRHVRGSKPFYLDIPDSHSILFVTGKPSQKTVFHIINRDTNQEIIIDGGLVNFGSNIGAKRNAGDPYTDYIEKANTNEIVVITRYSEKKVETMLDLISRVVK